MSCCTTLNHIARECGTGIRPGLKTTVYVACKDDVATIPADNGTSHTVASNITMASTKTFKVWDISQLDSSFVCEPQGDMDSRYFKSTVQIFIPAMSAAKSAVLSGITNGEYVVIVADAKGQRRLLGDLLRGAYITTQEQTNDKNGYVVTIEWESNETPFFYTGTITT
jgi:hypothetical protein